MAYKELKKTGVFLLPGFAKFVVIKKPATKARPGINPFTKEPTVFKARPARKLFGHAGEGRERRGMMTMTSVPIPKFASLCGALVCELRN